MSQQTDDEDANGSGGLQDGVVTMDRGPDRDRMTADYMPEAEQWSAKTVLDINDPAAIAALTQFGDLFPEVDDLQPVIDSFIGEFLPARTSVDGMSRSEYKDMIMSMYGGKHDSDSPAAWAAALGAADDDD